jgi:peptidoglycan/LPS O-acetylase OafA/YrhL
MKSSPVEGVPAADLPHPSVQPLDALTSLRFIAAMLVLVYHYSVVHLGDAPRTDLPSLGFVGVSFFFLLSGFILSYSYRTVNFSIGQNRRNFYWARVARIFPAFLLSLVFALPFFWLDLQRITSPPLHVLFASSAVLAPLGLHAWVPGAACALNCPSWSISTEFFFYLIFPFVFPLIDGRPRLWMGLCLAIWAATIALCSLVWSQLGHGLSIMDRLDADAIAGLASQFVRYFPVMRVAEFLLGILLFVFWERVGKRLPSAALFGAFAVALAALLACRSRVPDIVMHNGLTALAWAPLILLGANLRRGPMLWPAWVFLGRISFSLYLVHETVLSVMHALDKHLLGGTVLSLSPWCLTISSTIVAIGLSALLFSMVENPARVYIMDRRRRLGKLAVPARVGAAP